MSLRFFVVIIFCFVLLISAGCKSKPAAEPTPEMSKSMLKLRGYKFETKDFFRSIQSGDPAIINGFLQAGMDPNTKNFEGLTALTYAVKNTGPKTIRVIARKADINLKDDKGNGALHLAIRMEKDEVVDFLMSKKPDVNVTGKHGNVTNQSPLYAAMLLKKDDLVDKLLKLGADPNLADSDGSFPLAEAAVRKSTTLEFIKKLVENGADVNKTESNGVTPLIYVAANREMATETRNGIIKYLLGKGAKKDQKDKSGKTAADWSKQAGHSETTELLQ